MRRTNIVPVPSRCATFEWLRNGTELTSRIGPSTDRELTLPARQFIDVIKASGEWKLPVFVIDNNYATGI